MTQQLKPNPVLCNIDFCFNIKGDDFLKPKHYVDKTAYLTSLVSKYKICSLCRPRRFGKTLTLHAIADLFRHGVKNWQDCAVATQNLWPETEAYPVLFLSFGGLLVTSQNAFEQHFAKIIRDAVLKSGLDVENFKLNLTNKHHQLELNFNAQDPISLVQELFEQIDSQIVVLIDEYDVPLISAMHDRSLYDFVQMHYAKFYSLLKQYEGKIRFMLVSGVNRVSNLSIFSGFNNIVDISLEPEFAAIVGYTKEELLKYFAKPLLKISDYYDLSLEELIYNLKLHYDGYCFDPTFETSVFNTWDINAFLYSPKLIMPESHKFLGYWVNEGAISNFVLQFFKQKQLSFIDFIKQNIFLERCVSYQELTKKESFYDCSIETFLFNAGYLTLKRADADGFIIGFPNEHVKNFVANNLVASLQSFITKDKDLSLSFNKLEHNILNIFNLDISNQERKEILSSALVSVGVQANDCFEKEAQFRSLLCVMFKYCGLDVQFEVALVGGRIDLLVTQHNRSFIIELKVFHSALLSKQATEQDKARVSRGKLIKAFKQIKGKSYQRAVPAHQEVYLLAIVADCSKAEVTDLECISPQELDLFITTEEQKLNELTS